MIGIEEQESVSVVDTSLAKLVKPLNGKLNTCKRITSFQQHNVEMDMQLSLMNEVLEEARIALLRLAFATDEDRLALGDEGATRFHPICGTPPYAPLRYLR